MPEFEELRAFLNSVRIAHHIRGRIRLKLQGGVPGAVELSGAQARAFQSVLDRLPGIQSVQTNLLARSCTVIYDTDVISERAWGDFLSGIQSEPAGRLERILRDAYQEIADAQS
ncbi:cation transporter [Pseudothauera nasutitermitis]|uniref:Cation transporter n=1 Tax=Pseudothauera nasutitermitis TaxID=2565930 RepID=A0A4S4AZ83_9RHOO|nr:cation transporter [Pseudothauera nasutitermitis]THF65463.1 cation transporter [Pseudothauera nasutitermitis]